MEAGDIRCADEDINFQYMAQWTDRARVCLEKIRSLVCSGGTSRQIYRTAAKAGKNIDDMLEYPSVASEVKAIMEASNAVLSAQERKERDEKKDKEPTKKKEDEKKPKEDPSKIGDEDENERVIILAGLEQDEAVTWVEFAERQWRQFVILFSVQGKGQAAITADIKSTPLCAAEWPILHARPFM